MRIPDLLNPADRPGCAGFFYCFYRDFGVKSFAGKHPARDDLLNANRRAGRLCTITFPSRAYGFRIPEKKLVILHTRTRCRYSWLTHTVGEPVGNQGSRGRAYPRTPFLLVSRSPVGRSPGFLLKTGMVFPSGNPVLFSAIAGSGRVRVCSPTCR